MERLKITETYVITVDYNGLKYLPNYFKNILNQSYNDFKIIFVDNSTNNDSIKFIQKTSLNEIQSKKIIILKNKANEGFAKANNQGINKAFEDKTCKYIICLNNDTEVHENFLKELIKTSQKHENVGSVQSKMIWGIHPNLLDSVGVLYSKNSFAFNRGSHEPINKYNEEEEIFGTCAGACLYTRNALEDIKIDNNYFDNEYFAYFEDIDLALRLKWAGWNSWYCPTSKVLHFNGGTSKNLNTLPFYLSGRNQIWTCQKNIPIKFRIKYFILYLLANIMQIIIHLPHGNTILKSKYDGCFKYKNKEWFNKINKKVEWEEIEKWMVLKWMPNEYFKKYE